MASEREMRTVATRSYQLYPHLYYRYTYYIPAASQLLKHFVKWQYPTNGNLYVKYSNQSTKTNATAQGNP